MKMIKKIFLSDMKALFGNFFVLAIALGLCLLPALYAWFNIYSNWDPYGSTGNLGIAVASQDQGYTDAQGKTSNAGEEVLASLKKNKSIHWVFTTSAGAKKKVESGECYAAILLPKDFSQNMYDGFRQGLKRPRIQYYVNEKKNAVATKITDTAVENLENTLDEMHISIVVSSLFTKEAQVAGKIQEDQVISRLQEKIAGVSDTLAGYSGTLDALQRANSKLEGSLEQAGPEIKSIKEKAAEWADRDSTLLSQITKTNQNVNRAFSSAALHVEKAALTQDMSKKQILYQKAAADLAKAQKDISKITAAVRPAALSDALAKQQKTLVLQLKNQASQIQKLKKKLSSVSDSKKKKLSTAVENSITQQINTVRDTFLSVVAPAGEELADLADTLNRDIKNALANASENADLLQTIIDGTGSTLQSTDKGLTSLSQALLQISRKLDTVYQKLGNLSDSELVNRVSAFLSRDPKGYGAFFASPVKIKSQRVYPVKNYGSGVTPFYTTLAIWVGGIFLVSLIRVKPDPEKFPGARPWELFLGRFLLFFLLGQLQTLIVVAGNLTLLHTQCLYPRRFWLAAALASLTFSLLIYTLTVSFGDIGKAFVVVIVVIQIAGSSGTFPIEILPAFYRKIYIFFPFPYAINAMREAICGLNGNDYVIYLLELLLFGAASLFIGLFVRLPFRALSRFVEARMEDTEIM